MHSPRHARITLRIAGAWIVAIALAHLADPWVWTHVRDLRVNDRDWGRLLRSLGYLPLWLLAALALWLHQRRGRASSRDALALALAPTLAGAAAEIGKLLVRRLRPDPTTFGYTFRAFTDDPLSTRNLGMPSSHVAVAMGGAVVLAALFPGARWVWYTLAFGCAVVRVLALGHFTSDVTAAAALGWAVGQAITAWGRRGVDRERSMTASAAA